MSRPALAPIFSTKPGTISTEKSTKGDYTKGALLRTHSKKAGSGQHVEFGELLRRKESSGWEYPLSIGIISSKVDLDYLEEESPKEVPLVSVAVNSNTSEHLVSRRPPTSYGRIQVVLLKEPLHCKFAIITFPKCFRLIVTSANFTRLHWSDSVENSLFVLDSRNAAANSTNQMDPHFLPDIVSFLKHLKIPSRVWTGLESANFSTSYKLVLIQTRSGETNGKELGGLYSLQQGVEFLIPPEQVGRNWAFEFHCSSITPLSKSFLQALKNAAAGDVDFLGGGEDERKFFSIVFPTSQEMKEHNQWNKGAASIFSGTPDRWTSTVIGQNNLHQGLQLVRKTISHEKILLGLASGPPLSDTRSTQLSTNEYCKAYLYIGSANCTPSAWGNFTLTSEGKWHMTSNINEVGVAFQLRPEEAKPPLIGYVRPTKPYAQNQRPFDTNNR